MTERERGTSGGIDRRTTLKLAGLGVAGVATSSTLAAAGNHGDRGDAGGPPQGFPLALLNPRVRNAAHAWERGYVGRADRTLLITDTGIDARHGDLGPWNGVRIANDDGDSELRIADAPDGVEDFEDVPIPDRNDLPRLVSWHAEEGDPERPRDEGGHGTSVASIAGGTGRARSLDPETYLETWTFEAEGGRRQVAAGEAVELDFEVPGELHDAELFVGVAGRWLDVTLVGPGGEELASATVAPHLVREGAGSTVSFAIDPDVDAGSWDGERESLSADAVHDPDDGPADRTYTLRAEGMGPGPADPEIRLAAVSPIVELGTDLPEDGSIQPTDHPHRSPLAGLSETGGSPVHPGVAPGHSLAWAKTGGYNYPQWAVDHVARDAETYVSTFNVRAMNMSWGDPAGAPTGAVQNPIDNVHEGLATLARAGVIPVHAVMNQPGTPAGGNDTGSAAPESISTVNTNSLYGINTISSGGLVTVTDDGDAYRTPDVCAVGTDEVAAQTGGDTDEGEYGEESDYTSGTGTSFAAPSVTGLAGLVTQAMEEDGPEGLDFPAPEDLFADDLDDEDRLAYTLRAKSAILATASTTAFNAIPWHGDQAPVYTPDVRDPYEGFGRINHGAAVDAVSRDLTGRRTDGRCTLGLDVPDDEQAAAGYVTGPGEYDVTVSFEGYEGADADLTNGAPHVDVVVYDALAPEGVDDDGPATGTPTVVARHEGLEGSDAELSVSLGEDDVYLVVVKLVSVPGDGTRQLPPELVDGLPDGAGGFVFNGADVRATLDLAVEQAGQ